MNTASILIIALALLFLAALIVTWAGGFMRPRRVFANVVAGTVPTHPGVVTREAEAAFSAKHLLVKKGTSDTQILLCGANDKPIGPVNDTGASGDDLPVNLLGGAPATRIVVASEAITVGTDVFTAAGGKVSTLSATLGTYYKVGTALTAAAADGDEIEIAPCLPVPETV